jgi:hypothetical protein
MSLKKYTIKNSPNLMFSKAYILYMIILITAILHRIAILDP